MKKLASEIGMDSPEVAKFRVELGELMEKHGEVSEYAMMVVFEITAHLMKNLLIKQAMANGSLEDD